MCSLWTRLARCRLRMSLLHHRPARSVVLLGDPQQLDQPQQGSHPEGADVSALEHMLGDHKTIPLGPRNIPLGDVATCAKHLQVHVRGVLRGAAICTRRPRATGARLERLRLKEPDFGSNAVLHEGNQNSSIEEVDEVERIVSSLLRPGAQWIDSEGTARPMTADDVLVVAPYNSQVALLEERLGSKGVRAGTVDKFQGQEAPVVIYSMTTSVPRRCTAWDGVPLQPQSAERGDVTREMRVHSCRKSPPLRT